MSSHQSNYEPKLADRHASSHLRTYRHPHCPGWLIVLSNNGIPLATSDTGIKGYFNGLVAFEQVTGALNWRQKKGSNQTNEYYNIVTSTWRTYTGGNEGVSAWLESLFAHKLDKHFIEETGFLREMESSTKEWTTLYLFQTQSNYLSKEDRAFALSTLLHVRESQEDRTFDS